MIGKVIVGMGLVALNASAGVITLNGGGESSIFDAASTGIRTTPSTIEIDAIPGLSITTCTGVAGQSLYSGTSFGMSSAIDGQSDDKFDAGEVMYLVFHSDVRIDTLDFSSFDSTDTLYIKVGSYDNGFVPAVEYVISGEQDLYDTGGWEIDASQYGGLIQITAGDGSSVSLDAVELSVIPEPATLSLVGLFAFSALMIRRRLY